MYEEIEIMQLIAEKYSEEIRIFFEPSKSISEINTFEQTSGISLPDELREFYQLAGGFDCITAYMNLWSLETVAEHFAEGYNDWFEEGDGGNYVVLGSDGAGSYLLMRLADSHFLRYGDEGEVMEIPSLKDLLCWNIAEFYEIIQESGEDERVADYLERNADRL